MSEEENTPGRLEMQAYKADPANVESPTGTHRDIEKQYNAELLITQQQLTEDVTEAQLTAPTQDQKDALDANVTLNAGNGVASLADVAAQATAQTTRYTFRTATDAPATGEVKLDNADPSLATIVNLSNNNLSGTPIANILLLLGAGDKLVITDVADSTKVYNYDVSADASQIGGGGPTGYVAAPVTFFSQGAGGNIADAEDCAATAFFDGRTI